jgi:hypothetical protein
MGYKENVSKQIILGLKETVRASERGRTPHLKIRTFTDSSRLELIT